MVSFRYLAIAATTIATIASAAPTEKRQTFTPGALNNTQEFYIRMTVTDGDTKYTQYACKFLDLLLYHLLTFPVETYHTGAGMADPVFTNSTGSRAYLNGTNLQFDVSPYPFSANAFPSDTNYARWEPVTITSGYGSGPWVNNGPDGLQIDQEEFDGWIVCEWYHGINAPQLFQMIKGFDAPAYTIPSSCARVLLFPEFI